ncbi:MAG TPA: hypothetical protein VHG08_15690 [Longimicrobium sp.]|nr:hypothetical protein [Longimicrobium sp.]
MDARAESTDPIGEMLGVAPPEHDVRGRILVLALYALGVAAGAGLVMSTADEPGGNGWALPVAGILFAGAAFVAEAVRRFACWSWFFVAGWLVLLLLPMLDALAHEQLGPAELVSGTAAAMMLMGALHYLWLRRWDFWADPRLDARLPPPRRVSPQWRAARLSRLRSGGGSPRA